MKILFYVILLICFLSCKQNSEEMIIANKEEVFLQKSKTDTILKTTYSNKKIKDLILTSDSLKGNELHISFYENGNLKEKGLIGQISNKDINTKSSIETWFYYDQTNHLDSTVFYNNDILGKDYIEKKIYFKSGELSKIEKFNNYILYENIKKPIGIWFSYNKKGEIIQSSTHKNK